MAPRFYNARDLPGADDGGVISHGTPPTNIPTPGQVSNTAFNAAENALGLMYRPAITTPAFSLLQAPGTYEPPASYGPPADPNQMVTTGGSSSGSTSQEVVLPPALDLLAEMRARRAQKRQDDLARLVDLVKMMSENLPANQKYYTGYEPGGLHDTLMGIITGKGTKEVMKLTPEDQRLVQRELVPIPSDIAEPEVGDEMGQAQSLAEQLTAAMKVVQTGTSGGSSFSQQPANQGSAGWTVDTQGNIYDSSGNKLTGGT
jgi:hypothetical protein